MVRAAYHGVDQIKPKIIQQLIIPALLLGASPFVTGQASFDYRAWDSGIAGKREYRLLENNRGLLTLEGKNGIFAKVSSNSLSAADKTYLRSIGLPASNTPCPSPELVYLRQGSFRSGDDLEGARSFIGRRRAITLPYDFWIGRFEVTQGEWEAVMEYNPSIFRGKNLPVETVNWYQAMDFCDRLTEMEREAGRLPNGFTYRLPTNVEWEYAAQGGKATATGMGPSLAAQQANFFGKFPFRTASQKNESPNTGAPRPVGSYKGNDWGLADMHGNVWEWCLDIASSFDWASPRGSGGFSDTQYKGFDKTIRGGSWQVYGQLCRASYFIVLDPFTVSSGDLGFRIVLGPKDPNRIKFRKLPPNKPSRQLERLIGQWKKSSEQELKVFWQKNDL